MNFDDFSDDDLDNELPLAVRAAMRVGLKLDSEANVGGSSNQRKQGVIDLLSSPSSNCDAEDSRHGLPGRSNERLSTTVCITPPPPETPDAPSSRINISPILQSVDSILNIPKPKVLRKETKKSSPNDVLGKGAKRKYVEKPAKKKAKQPTGVDPKRLKEAEKLVSKQTDKSEVNKYMECILDPEVVSCPPGADILNALTYPSSGKQEEVFTYRVDTQPMPGLLTWRRKLIGFEVNDETNSIDFIEEWRDEGRCLLFTSCEQLARKLKEGVLESWMKSVQIKVKKHITLMIYDFNSYFKKDTSAKEKARKAAIRGENLSQRNNSCLVPMKNMQEALLMLSVEGIADYQIFDRSASKGWLEAGRAVFHLTRAVSEAPEKLKKGLSGSASFGFWAKADCRDSISPKNLPEYWKQVIMQVTSMSLEKANSIARLYPSPAALMAAYSGCSSENEAQSLLANIEVRRVDTILGGNRRLGDDISRKMYHALTSRDGSSFLAK